MVRPVPGARVVYRPVARTPEQEQTEAYAAALFASEAEQTRVNDEYLRAHPEAAQAVSGARSARTPPAVPPKPPAPSGAPAVSGSPVARTPMPAAPSRPVAVSPPAPAPRSATVEDAGAAAARALIAVSPPRHSDDAAFEAGAASARALISPGDQTPYRQASPPATSGAQGSTEHDAGAAEARRLLGYS